MDISVDSNTCRVSFESSDFEGNWNWNDIRELYQKAIDTPEFKEWNTENNNFSELGFEIQVGFDWFTLTFKKPNS